MPVEHWCARLLLGREEVDDLRHIFHPTDRHVQGKEFVSLAVSLDVVRGVDEPRLVVFITDAEKSDRRGHGNDTVQFGMTTGLLLC